MTGPERFEIAEGELVFPAVKPPDGGPAEMALQHTADGELVAVGFTTIDGLVAAFGPEQRWVAFAAEAAPAVLEGSGVRRIVVDPEVTFRA